MVTSPLKWIGGKAESARRIVSAFPAPTSYDFYVEGCGGAAHVLMQKPRYHHKEFSNDKDNLLVNFWLEMRSNAGVMSNELLKRPYARKLYYDYYHSLYPSPESTLSSTEKAIRWFYILRSNMTGYLRPSPTGWNYANAETVKTVVAQFALVQERIKDLAIDNRDVVATITRYEKLPGRIFFYLDPPYHGVEHYYPASRTGFDHVGLTRVLQTVQSPVALSYYPHPDLDQLYPPERWRRIIWQQHKPSNIGANVRAEELDMATEMLLCNYPAQAVAPSLWELTQEEVPHGNENE
jgi:DNA adenine methylase